MSWAGLMYVSVAFPDHTQLLLQKEHLFPIHFSYFENNTVADDKLAHKVIESDQFELFNGVLCHFYQSYVKSLPAAQRLVHQLAIPDLFRQNVHGSYHDSHASDGHLGVQKLFAASRECYILPGMYPLKYDCYK